MDYKLITIHQPMFLPYTGCIAKILAADEFTFLDDVQFADGQFQNRNRILTKEGTIWITVPLKSPRYKVNLKDIRISYHDNWKKKLLTTLQHAYGKAKYFEEVMLIMKDILYVDFEFLVDLNIYSTKMILKYFGYEKPTLRSSNIEGKPEDRMDRIIFITKYMNGSTFLSGDGAKCYLDVEYFRNQGVNVEFQNYECKEYPQLWGNEFVPYMSILDYMMNIGNERTHFLETGKICKIEK